jgi:hypothetical protein
MRAVLKNHAHQKISAIKPMVLSINFIFKTEVEGHYPQENSFHHQFGTGPDVSLIGCSIGQEKYCRAKAK